MDWNEWDTLFSAFDTSSEDVGNITYDDFTPGSFQSYGSFASWDRCREVSQARQSHFTPDSVSRILTPTSSTTGSSFAPLGANGTRSGTQQQAPPQMETRAASQAVLDSTLNTVSSSPYNQNMIVWNRALHPVPSTLSHLEQVPAFPPSTRTCRPVYRASNLRNTTSHDINDQDIPSATFTSPGSANTRARYPSSRRTSFNIGTDHSNRFLAIAPPELTYFPTSTALNTLNHNVTTESVVETREGPSGQVMEKNTRKRKATSSEPSASQKKKPKKPRQQLAGQALANYRTMRLVKACLRCHKLKKSCDDIEICSRCTSVATALRKYGPCYRDDLEKVIAFRDGNSRANMTPSQLPTLKWATDETQVRHITLAFPFKGGSTADHPTLSMGCREFVPRDGIDILTDVWEGDDGEKLILEFPAWALWQTEIVEENFLNYIDSCADLLEADLSTEEDDPITTLTMQEAARLSFSLDSSNTDTNAPSMISMALKIRRIAYFCRESMIITSEETLGIKKIFNPKFSSLHNTVPVPSVLDFQIDTIAIMSMRKLLKSILLEMHSRLFDDNGKEHWFEVFLVCFVLLSSLEKVHELQLKYMGWNNEMDGMVYMNIKYLTWTMIDQWKHSASVLLKHFRQVIYGMSAFSLAWDQPDIEIPWVARKNLDGESKHYLSRLKEKLAEKDEEFRAVKEQNGQPYAWRSRLFLDDGSVL